MKEYKLKTAQNGFAAGPAFLIETAGASRAYEAVGTSRASDPETEFTRFCDAVSALEKELSSAAAQAGEENAEIFEMEALLLKDETFTETAADMIRTEGRDAASAAEAAGTALAESLRGSGDAYISQRSEDITGLTVRLAGLLRGEEKQTLEEPSIIAADELSPAQLSAIDQNLILGIVTAKGAPTSHVSILAGNLDIPYCYGSEEAIAQIRTGAPLILGDGALTVDPEENAYQAALQKAAEAKAEKGAEAVKAQSASDAGRRTKVYANIAGPQDIDALLASGAEGVGLFRSEFLFLSEDAAPTEDEQYDAYRKVAEAMAGKETVIRTMDLGSDKKAGWLHMPEEKNPALGCRGLRLSLQEEELFRSQLRALLRAAGCGNVKIMVPMIASCWEVDAVRERLHNCAAELSAEGVSHRIPPLGIMVETPAAAMIADQLAEKVDFFSIGTNDLTQYTLALDREAQGLDEYYDPCHEAVLRLIERTASAGHAQGIPTAICGELAANPDAIRELIWRGVDELSVSIAKVAGTKACAAAAETMPAQDEEDRSGSGRQPALLAAPADGQLIPMEDIPDKAFASGILGECVGILPTDGKIYAPCDGTVSDVAETKHAITFTDTDGRNILVHAGLDTVKLQGEGLTVIVKAGDTVSAGDLVMEMNLDTIRSAGLSTIVITTIIPE